MLNYSNFNIDNRWRQGILHLQKKTVLQVITIRMIMLDYFINLLISLKGDLIFFLKISMIFNVIRCNHIFFVICYTNITI